jgi:hypothetical protein
MLTERVMQPRIEITRKWSDNDVLLLTWQVCDGTSICSIDGYAELDWAEPGRRHSVQYSHPDFCCRTVACEIVTRVRLQVEKIH